MVICGLAEDAAADGRRGRRGHVFFFPASKRGLRFCHCLRGRDVADKKQRGLVGREIRVVKLDQIVMGQRLQRLGRPRAVVAVGMRAVHKAGKGEIGNGSGLSQSRRQFVHGLRPRSV